MNRLRWLFLLTLLVAGALTHVARAQDKLYVPKGAATSGTVTAMSPEKVTMELSTGPRDFAVNEIVRLVYGDEPPELTKVRDSLREGQVESAYENLKRLNVDNIVRDVVRQDVEYYKAYCQAKMSLTGGGNSEAADEALMAFVRNNRGSYHVFEATKLLGHLAVAQGNFPVAAKRSKFLGQAPWPEFRLKANVNEARALTLAKSFREALERNEAIMASSENTAEANRQKLLASDGRAVCLAETGKAD